MEFDSNGNFKLKKIPQGRIISITSTIEGISSNNEESQKLDMNPRERNLAIWPLTMEDFFTKIDSVFPKTKNRLKVLTLCNKSRTICRFLMCPNIRQNCILCDVKMSDHSDSHCELFDTSYLLK